MDWFVVLSGTADPFALQGCLAKESALFHIGVVSGNTLQGKHLDFIHDLLQPQERVVDVPLSL